MKSLLARTGAKDRGALSLQWVLLTSMLAIGVAGGLSAVRDASITELGNAADAAVSLDRSFTVLRPWGATFGNLPPCDTSDSKYAANVNP